MWSRWPVILLSGMPSAKRFVKSARDIRKSTTAIIELWLCSCAEVLPINTSTMWCNCWLAVASLIIITYWPKLNAVSSSSELFIIPIALWEAVADHHYIWNVMQLLAGSRIIYVDQSLKEDWLLLLAALLGTVAIVLSFACSSRQKDPIQRNAFVDIYSIVCVSGLLPDSAVWHAARHLQQHVPEFHGWTISRTFWRKLF